MQDAKNNNSVVNIPVYRAGMVVASLLGTLGVSLKETRLTAWLGYLIAESSDSFRELLGLRGDIVSVSLENHHEDGRSDILVETDIGLTVIEAKVDATDPLRQAMKYNAQRMVLLTQYVPTHREQRKVRLQYVSWQQLAGVLKRVARSRNPKVRFVSSDLLNYLEAHRMIRTKESVEVYAREINVPETLRLFLQGQLYVCDFEKSRLTEALYFAPHFGMKIVATYPGVGYGISYLARIEDVQIVETKPDVFDILTRIRGKRWLKAHRHLLEPEMKKWKWEEGHRRYFLFLGMPRLVFNPPVKKGNLQGGSGYLSKRFLSFDELFAAWKA